MIKVFDYEKPRSGWVEFASRELAEKYVNEAFEDYFWDDRDHGHDYFIEIYEDGEYTVWCMEAGSWWPEFRDEETDDAYKSIYYGKREEWPNENFTTLKPRVDYIIIR